MKLAILDRDGTLNAWAGDPVTTPAQWQALPGALEALARLHQAGWHVVLATNQPGLGTGRLDTATMVAIHARMHRELAALGGRIDAVFYCPHAPDEPCTCRKPGSGLLQQIRDRYALEGRDLAVIGSCLDHLQAGAPLGAQLHLVCTGAAAVLDPAAPLTPAWPAGTRAHASLAAAVDALLG
ncbi:HAD-IIIA family hydrolase [Melaminivora sp.]|uniref:D-glycero-alpha-D-manno-heptose-1,7-bisphosphate 7-phosphatase n=1 Tax=Melaminivora sp. TaxID=1933032 RepID=UPI0028B161A1|nr:HAD-IIIA family hydrolase [Melaminivora sp.]